jgi:hypothetical protein
VIAELRRRHRWSVTVLFVVVVFLYAWAIFARKAHPRVAVPPGELPKRAGSEHVVP